MKKMKKITCVLKTMLAICCQLFAIFPMKALLSKGYNGAEGETRTLTSYDTGT